MNDEQIKLAAEISEILKDKNMSTADRVIKMKTKLGPKFLNETSERLPEPKETPPTTYDSHAIKKAALRNQILKKNQNNIE